MTNVEINRKIDGIRTLFSFHRNENESWHYLLQHFMLEESRIVQRTLISIFRYIDSHGDIFWHAKNHIEYDVLLGARTFIRKNYGLNEVRKLLWHIDEAGIRRGSIGQDVYPLIDLIPNKIDYLKKIIMDGDLSDDEKSWAGIILIDIFQRSNIERAISLAQSMITHFPKSKQYDGFKMIKEVLIRDGYFNLVE